MPYYLACSFRSTAGRFHSFVQCRPERTGTAYGNMAYIELQNAGSHPIMPRLHLNFEIFASIMVDVYATQKRVLCRFLHLGFQDSPQAEPIQAVAGTSSSGSHKHLELCQVRNLA
jgi:hypothetical protein